MKVRGHVYDDRYEIEVLDADDNLVDHYVAGNNPQSSSIEDNVQNGVHKTVLFKWCQETASGMAQEHGTDDVVVEYAE